MAEQLRLGVLRDKDPETFVVVWFDPQESQCIERIAFPKEKELREMYKNLSDADFEHLLARVRAHPTD